MKAVEIVGKLTPEVMERIEAIVGEVAA
jgi:hypothetical protein